MQVTAQDAYNQSVIKEGIRVDFSLSHVDAKKSANEFREGDNVRFRFKISDTISGKALSGVSLAAWMDKRTSQEVPCRKKIKSFIEGGFLKRPELDLNTYYVLTLNSDSTINVVNPLFGFGGSQLLTQIQLPATGYDWVMKDDQTAFFVSMPEANQVACISTSEMKNLQNITLPGKAQKLLLQKDEHYLWVAYTLDDTLGTKSGVAVIDVENKVLVKTILTGKGIHDMVMGESNQYVYVSNQTDGTVSIIDCKTLSKIKDLKVNGTPISMAFAAKAQALYVVDKINPVISVIDEKKQQIVKEIVAETGIEKIYFSPDGRFGFVINSKNNTILIIDAATNTIVQIADVEPQPDEISFSDKLAYIRHKGSEIIDMIPLDAIGIANAPVPVADFNGGQNPPALGSPVCGALGIIQAPGANVMLVSNFKDQAVYYYQEGMAAPMGSFNTYGKNPKAVLVIDKSIRERADGIYETTAVLNTPGSYDLGLYINVPLIMECFEINVLPDPSKVLERNQSLMGPLAIKYVSGSTRPKVGERINYTFQLIDLKTNQPIAGLGDVNVMDMLTTPNQHSRTAAKETTIKGIYEANIQFNQEGLYYVYVECQSRGLSFNNPQFLILYASK